MELSELNGLRVNIHTIVEKLTSFVYEQLHIFNISPLCAHVNNSPLD